MQHPQLTLFRITRNTNLWRKGQRVWVIFGTGALAAYCVGRFRGKGHWIKGWVHVADKSGKGFCGQPNARHIGWVTVTPEFRDRLNRLAFSWNVKERPQPGTTQPVTATARSLLDIPCGVSG